MSAYPFASSAKVEETLDVLGTRNIATTQQTLLQQILVASAISGFPAPTGFTATAGNQQITLSWDAQPAADTFTIKFGITNVLGAASVLTSSATGTSFVFDSGESIQAGEKYYFWISATGSEGTSSFSSSVTARSFVTVADGAMVALVTPTGSWTLGTLLFRLAPPILPDGLTIDDGNGWETVGGDWFDSDTFDPANNHPISGAFTFANLTGVTSITFWDTEP